MGVHAAAARTRPSWLGLGLESQLGSRSPDGPGAGKGGAARGRVCLSGERSLGAGDREGGRAGEEGCGSVEAAATGTRRHHLRRRGRRSRRSRRLSWRGAAAGTASRRPARPGRCPSPSEVSAAPWSLLLQPPALPARLRWSGAASSSLTAPPFLLAPDPCSCGVPSLSQGCFPPPPLSPTLRPPARLPLASLCLLL